MNYQFWQLAQYPREQKSQISKSYTSRRFKTFENGLPVINQFN